MHAGRRPAADARRLAGDRPRRLAAAPRRPCGTSGTLIPSFAAVAVDMVRNEVVLTDENLFQVLVYDRTENTPAGAEASKPKRVIVGREHEYRVSVRRLRRSEDRRDLRREQRHARHAGRLRHGSAGNVKPVRQVETPHGTFGVAVDEVHGELFMTEQHDSALVVYRKDATQEESPIRFLQGVEDRPAGPARHRARPERGRPLRRQLRLHARRGVHRQAEDRA